MKTLKKILIIIAIIIAIPLIIALFVRKDFKAEREVIINKPVEEVFNYVKYLKNQEKYGKWYRIDPNMKTTYKGEDGTPGFMIKWESDNDEVGCGEQEITNIVENKRIDFELRFLKPMESKAPVYMETEAINESQTKVKWAYVGKMPYPMNLMLLFNMEELIGKDFQTGLDNLKMNLEQE